MKQTKNFNIVVPELGDKPDITQVSDAIQSLEDALAGTLEVMNATLNGTALILVSGARTTKRTKYYDGMSIRFIAPSQIAQNTLTSVKVDDLAVQTLQIPYLVNSGDSVDIVYKGNKFIGAIAAIQRSNDISSASTTTVATSNAVKQLNDNKAEKSIQIIAGNGLTGGGNLTSNKTINVVSADEGIVVNADNIKLNIVDAVNSTNTLRPASANSVKTAYDNAISAQHLSNTHSSRRDNPHGVTKAQIGLENVGNYSSVNKNGDTMNGNLEIASFAPMITLSEIDTGKKAILVADGEGGRFQRETVLGSNIFNWTSTGAAFFGGADYINNPIKITIGKHSEWTNMSDSINMSLSNIGAFNKDGDSIYGNIDMPNDGTGINMHGGCKVYKKPGSGPAIDMGTSAFVSIDKAGSTLVKVDAGGDIYAGGGTLRVFHKGFTPTKDDVGLSEVQNYPITNSVTDASGTKYASANAVKQAYDRGTEAIANANSRLPLSNAWINYFKESGDTPTLVDKLISPGQYQCGANTGTYHLSYINVYEMYPHHIRQVREHWDGGSAWREIYRTGNPDFTNIDWNFYLDTKNINERYCPYRVGDILTTTIPSNPAEVWVGTGWEKIEHVFLYAHNSAGSRGGGNSTYLNVGHLPPHNHGADYIRRRYADGEWDWRPSVSVHAMDGYYAPSDNVGSGVGIDNMPNYYTVHVWKRVV